MCSTSSIIIIGLISSLKLGGVVAYEEISPLEERFAFLVRHVQILGKQLEKLQKKVAELERTAHTHPNTNDTGIQRAVLNRDQALENTSSGSFSYKLFEQRKTWEDAQKHCNSFDAGLVVIDSEEKNDFVKGLFKGVPTVDYVWIGTKIRGNFDSSRKIYDNFDKESSINGCAAMDNTGVWSIHSCTQLYPFVCEMMVLTK